MGWLRIALPIVVLLAAAVAEGQERPAPRSVEPAPLVVQASSSLKIPPVVWGDPPARRFGVVTLLPPDARGQFVRVAIPIGELAMRAGRAAAAARHRRAERTAQEVVLRALQDYRAKR